MALTTELRIFPDKELFAIDMAEILDTAVMFSGVIQGCGVTFNQVAGTLTVESGRILIRGRLGVITTSGDVAAPVVTGSANVTCYLVAACNLSTLSQPFTVEIVTPATYEEYQQRKESTADTFNTQDGFDFIVLGTVSVNPTSGKITGWAPSSDVSTDRSNLTLLNAIADKATRTESNLNALSNTVNSTTSSLNGRITTLNNAISTINNSLTWKAVTNSDVKGATLVNIPAGAREVYAIVQVVWDNIQRDCVTFFIPITPVTFVGPSSTPVYVVNYWGTDYNGFVRLRCRWTGTSSNYVYSVNLADAYAGTNNVTANCYTRYYYR